MLSITADQMSAAAGYLTRNWGDYGYRFEAIESPTHRVSLFRVCCSDGGRFTIAADRYGNARHLDTHNGDEGLSALVSEMHAAADPNT